MGERTKKLSLIYGERRENLLWQNSPMTYFVKRFKDRGHKGWEVREKRPHILDFRVFKGNNLIKTGGRTYGAFW